MRRVVKIVTVGNWTCPKFSQQLQLPIAIAGRNVTSGAEIIISKRVWH